MATGRAPGPDGLPLTYYKKLSPDLGPHLLKMFNSLTSGSLLCRDSLRAHITVIPKPGKDPLLCPSYRPISLLNVDLKILAKILSSRLTPLIGDIIHPDQAGFMPGREARDNTIKAVNLLHGAKISGKPLMLLSTDAEKAFDRVNWQFMEETLLHVGIRQNMMNWILSLYSYPSAQVRVNGLFSQPFPIANGTRQGCPMSPLIFILTLEPFLRHVRSHPDISGIAHASRIYKVAAYADDLLFFLTCPQISLPCLMSAFDEYSGLSNFKINFSKSEALNVTLPSHQVSTLGRSFPFRWATRALTYLGVSITPDPADLFRANFPPMLASIRSDCHRWKQGTFTWFGRCTIFKMNILPRLLYLLQTLPIHIPLSFFRTLSSIQLDFIWLGKPARVSRALLSRPKRSGGMALPDLKLYYFAAHLARIVDWCRHDSLKPWVYIEQAFSPLPLQAIPWLEPSLVSSLRSHPTIGPTLRVCAQRSIRNTSLPLDSSCYPLLGNPRFPSGVSDRVFRNWRRHGYFRVAHLRNESGWQVGPGITPSDDLPPLDAWRGLQIRHFVQSLPPPAEFRIEYTPLEQLCLGTEPLRHSLAIIYKLLVEPPPDAVPHFILKWESDLDLTLTQAQRERIFRLAHETSISSRHQEASFKLLTRWYRVPSRLHAILPQVPSTCWRCGVDEGTMLHIFWSCNILSPFWDGVKQIIVRVTETPHHLGPALFLLHHCESSVRIYKRSLLRFLVIAARACIPQFWKRTEPPPLSLWVLKVNEIMRVESLTSFLHDTVEIFNKTWFSWMEFQGTNEYRALLGPVAHP